MSCRAISCVFVLAALISGALFGACGLAFEAALSVAVAMSAAWLVAIAATVQERREERTACADIVAVEGDRAERNWQRLANDPMWNEARMMEVDVAQACSRLESAIRERGEKKA